MCHCPCERHRVSCIVFVSIRSLGPTSATDIDSGIMACATDVHNAGLYWTDYSHDIGVSEAYVCRYKLSHISADAYYSISRRSYQLIEVLPVVLRHQTERTQQRPRKVVEISISVVGIWTSDDAVITRRTFPARTHVGRNKNTAFSKLIFQLFSSHNKK